MAEASEPSFIDVKNRIPPPDYSSPNPASIDVQPDRQEKANRCVSSSLSLAEVERQRRRSMKDLCSTLMSLVPSQDGKHSLADRLHQAAQYIDSLKARVSDLEKEIKLLKSDPSVLCCRGQEGTENVPLDCKDAYPQVTLRKLNASHVELSVNRVWRGFAISTILAIVHQSGSSVVSVSTCAVENVNCIMMLLQFGQLNRVKVEKLFFQVSENFVGESLCDAIKRILTLQAPVQKADGSMCTCAICRG